MKVLDTNLKLEIKKTYSSNESDFHFFDNILISEIKEGEHVSLDVYKDHFHLMAKHFNSKPFAYIANRINSYSVNPIDFPKFFELLPNLEFFGSINYSKSNGINLQIEKHFCNLPYKDFKDLNEAYCYVNDYLNNIKIKKS